MRPSERLLVGAGLAMATFSVVAGAGYVLTPVGGPPGTRYNAWNAPVEQTAAAAGIAGGFALAAATVWLGVALRRRARVRRPLVATGLLVAGFLAASVFGLMASLRADPPLPPSWNWIRIPQAVGVATAALWIASALATTARRTPPR